MRSGEPPLSTSDAGCERGKCLPTSCLWHGSVHWCRLLKIRTWKKTPIFWKLGIAHPFWIAHPKHECYGPDSLQVHHVSRQSLLSLRLLVCTLPTSRQDNGNLKKKKHWNPKAITHWWNMWLTRHWNLLKTRPWLNFNWIRISLCWNWSIIILLRLL